MKTKPKSVGRSYLVGRLRDQGLSRRRAVLVVNVILSRTIHALRRGREVEFPFGTLNRVERHFSEFWDSVHDSPANRSPYTVEYELNREGFRVLYGNQESKTGRKGTRKTGK